jgi:hypothetical protein
MRGRSGQDQLGGPEYIPANRVGGPNTGGSPFGAAAGHRSRDVTPVCRQALFSIATRDGRPRLGGPRGRLRLGRERPRVGGPPRPGGVHQSVHVFRQRHRVCRLLGWSVGHGPPWRHRPTTTRAGHRPQGPSCPRQLSPVPVTAPEVRRVPPGSWPGQRVDAVPGHAGQDSGPMHWPCGGMMVACPRSR